MAYKYEDVRDKKIRSSFPATEVDYDTDGDPAERTALMEVSDIRGEIVEIMVDENRYINLPIAQFLKAIENHKTDYKE